MGMTAKLYSLNALSVELNRDRRTLGHRLARVKPDGQTEAGDPAWYLTTALRVLGNGGERANGGDADLDALEEAAVAVDDLLDRLRAEPSLKKRRAVLQRDGGMIGAFVDALDRVRAGHGDAMRRVEEPFCNQMVGGVIGEVLHFCDWTLAEMPSDRHAERKK
jgi:hypothetical protein